MKKTILVIISAFLFISLSTINTSAQKLGKFGSTIEKTVGPKTVRVPYTDVISYLGYAAKGNEDAVVDGKKFYYIYLWIPLVAPEIGVRMMSPVGKTKIKNAIMAADYEKNAKSKEYFDTYITIERSTIIKKENINKENVEKAKWFLLEKNDDSSEMPPLPSGSKYNSLLRYKSEVSDPLKALTIGLYRIGFTTYKKGEVNGTFLAEVGAPIKLPGVAIAKTLEELNKQLKK